MNFRPVKRWRGLSRTRRAIAGAVLVPALAAMLLAVSVPGAAPVLVQDKPGVETVMVDGKKYAKEGTSKTRLDAKDFELAHDGLTPEAKGQVVGTPSVWHPWNPAGVNYQPNPHNWWMEAEVYILHRQELVGNPPVQFDYYRAGFVWASLRGDWSENFGWFEANEFLALNEAHIWVTLVQHPIGDTLTTNEVGPIRLYIPPGQPGVYTCDYVTAEVSEPYDPDYVVRTNLVVRPIWKYFDPHLVQFRTMPYNQVRRMTHSEGLVTDGSGNTTQEAYTDVWSDFVSAPSGTTHTANCAPETIDEPGM